MDRVESEKLEAVLNKSKTPSSEVDLFMQACSRDRDDE